MGKVLIASFDREEEQDFEELVLFLKEKGYRDFTGMASADNVLKYNDLKINPKYRTVRNQGEDIKLTNYEFENRDYEKIIGFVNEIMDEGGMNIAAVSNSGNIVIDSLIGYWYVTAQKKNLNP